MSSMKNARILAAIAILFAAAFLLARNRGGAPSADGPLADLDGVVLHAYALDGAATGHGALSVPYLRAASVNERFLNLAADLDGDGSLSGEEWLVRNGVVSAKKGYRNNFTAALPSELPEGGIAFAVELSPAPLASFPDRAPSSGTLAVVRRDLGALLGVNEPGASPELKRGLLGPFSIPASRAENAPGSFPATDVESPYQIPDLPQGSMECVPMSVLNNLIALAGANGRLDDLSRVGNIGQIKEQLKRDMRFNKGVLLRNIKAGKDAFAARHGFPIETMVVENPRFEQIRDAIASNCVVEISMDWRRSRSGKPDTGHVFTGTALWSDGKDAKLMGHDPATPEGQDAYDLMPPAAPGGPLRIAYPGWDGDAAIDGLVVQCWGDDKAFLATLAEAPRPAGTVRSPEPAAFTIEMLEIAGALYPKYQFVAAGPDRCDGDHYHKHSPAFGLKSRDSAEIVLTADPVPDGCGFGKVGEVPVVVFEPAWDQQMALVMHAVN